MRTVTVENIGAVKTVEIPIQEDGGLVVLRGRQGRGKSTVLRAVDSLLAGDGALEKRDGAVAGRVDGFVATITVKRSCRRSGTLEVESLDSRLSIAELVDPHIADPIKADAKRIKALVQLSGAHIGAGMFRTLFSDEATYLRATSQLDGEDAVSFAAQVKRNVEFMAREAEAKAVSSDKGAAGLRAIVGDVAKAMANLQSPEELRSAHEAAVRVESTLKANAASAKRTIEAAEKAKAVLDKAHADYKGLSVDAAKMRSEAAEHRLIVAQRELDDAKTVRDLADTERELAAQACREANRHEANMTAWKESINAAATVTVPTQDEIITAVIRVEESSERIEQAALARKAAKDLESAENLEADARREHERADLLRHTAKCTDNVLSDAVGNLSVLRVKDGRLVLDTDRGEELFGDLSDGERWRVAFDAVAPFVPADGVLTIPQAAYGELDPVNRREINELCKARRIVVITAEATEDESLRADVFA